MLIERGDYYPSQGIIIQVEGSYDVPASLLFPVRMLEIIGGSPDGLRTLLTIGWLIPIIEGFPDGLLHVPGYLYEIQA